MAAANCDTCALGRLAVSLSFSIEMVIWLSGVFISMDCSLDVVSSRDLVFLDPGSRKHEDI